MNIKAFFRRIGMPEDTVVTHTYDFLKTLQYNHVLTVPYENLDILSQKPLSLAPEDIYEKIVTHHRGGYCFEVNGLLSAVLTELGFEVKNHFARYLRGETEIPARRHRVLAVKAEDGIYICDVGIGQSAPRYPVKLEEGLEQSQCGEVYKFEKDPFLGWVLYDLHKGEWRKYFSFTEEEQLDIDFSHSSFFCEKHPDSPFNKAVMVAVKTPDGRKTLDDRVYKVFRADELIHIESELSDERRALLLKEEFGLDWEA